MILAINIRINDIHVFDLVPYFFFGNAWFFVFKVLILFCDGGTKLSVKSFNWYIIFCLFNIHPEKLLSEFEKMDTRILSLVCSSKGIIF